MKVALLYLYVVSPGSSSSFNSNSYAASAKRFADSYRKYPAGTDHDLHVVCCNGPKDAIVQDIFKGIKCVYDRYDGPGLDIGTHQHMATVLDCDFMVCTSSMTHFRKEGWLDWFVIARRMHGDGLYGSMGSMQGCPFMPWNKPNPHIRTCFYALSPAMMNEYPNKIVTKEDSFAFESGPESITVRTVNKNMPVMMVTWDGAFTVDNWRTYKNIYCRGDQSALLSFDRWTDTYEASDPGMKARLEAQADGR